MTASSRGSRAVGSIIRSSRRRPALVCSQCHSLSTPSRAYAVAAASLKTLDDTPNRELPHVRSIPPLASTSPYGDYTIKAGILLSRPPILTRSLHPFEKAFFFYQKRLQERLALPFARYFYFKKDTPGDLDWKLKAKLRNGAASRDLGGYTGHGDEAWNDELLVRDKKLAETRTINNLLVEDAVPMVNEDGVVIPSEQRDKAREEAEETTRTRWQESDIENDQRKLDRRLDQTLYLVVQREGGSVKGKQGGGWGFPSGEVLAKENLDQASERVLEQTAGVNMNTWIVGHVPIGHQISKPRYNPETKALETPGSKTFFMKGRIMAGQVNLKGNKLGLGDYKWLTKEEVQKHVSDKYFAQVKNMMGDR